MSRLENSIETARLRESLISKNLYSPTNIYEIDNPAIVDAINAIANVAFPFKSFDVTNTVLGRLIGPNTPIAQIGLIQLGKQLGQTIVSQGSSEIIPTFSFKNLFDKNPNTKFALRKIDYRITRDESQSSFSKILESLTGSNVLSKNPFNESSTDIDIIRNTGKGQLALLSDTLSRNYYRNSSNIYRELENQGFQPLNIKVKSYGYFSEDAPYFNDSNLNYGYSTSQLRDSLSQSNSPYQEYASSLDKKFGLNKGFIDALGRTDNNQIIFEEDRFDKTSNGFFEDINTQIIWGKSGVSEDTLELQSSSREKMEENIESQDIESKFGSRTGLLKYTSDLLNAYGGNIIDQTRKKFYKKTDIQKAKGSFVGYNGSGLYTSPDTAYVERLRNKEGIRQHTIIDPYDRFAKAIRFEGNKQYNGNPDSIIYDTVLPNIKPTRSRSSDTIDKRVMFSIENLAFQLNEMGDIFGIPEGLPNIRLPECEIGTNKGRLMWFAPYDINLEEQASAKWEATNFIGRNEPMYSYGFSERTATLSFKLIIDCPPQVRNLTTHKEFADFFAFGNNVTNTKEDTNNLPDKEKRLKEIDEQITELGNNTIEVTSKNISYEPINFYFPNDVPSESEDLTSTIENMLFQLGYEDGVSNDAPNVNDDGLNSDFYDKVARTIESIVANDETQFLRLDCLGYASKLYEDRSKEYEYNDKLGERRAIALYHYFDKQLKFALQTSKELEELNVQSNIVSFSSSLAVDSTALATNVNTRTSKESRFGTIKILNNGFTVPRDETTVANPNQSTINQLIEERTALEQEIAKIKTQQRRASNCTFEPFSIDDNDGIIRGFERIRANKFAPVFHSQTPEDFHKRLTFLQQCVRQGAALTYSDRSSSNSSFGRQPVCVLKLGDFYHTKVIIDNINFSYSDSPWDTNPEGWGMQFMICDVTMSLKVIGGQSLKGPIDVLQNAIGFNYYANSTFSDEGIYALPKAYETLQYGKDDKKK